ncbi:MAG: MotB family protein [Pseudomonadota bacterium]
MQQEEMAHGEIIIVRRGSGGHEDEHHGGVWKIAFADFMTAMMAFFLVMWLINASNEETKKAVASYFNPVKLIDTNTNPKGIQDPKFVKKSSTESVTLGQDGGDTGNKGDDPIAEKKFVDEQALFADPYAVLAEIAKGGQGGKSGQERFNADEPGSTDGITNGVSFQDPFDPNAWESNNAEESGIDQQELAQQITPDKSGEEEGKEGSRGFLNLEADDADLVDENELKREEIKPEETQAAETKPEEPKPEVTAQEEATEPAPTDTAEIKQQEEKELKIAEATQAIENQIKLAFAEEDLSGLELEVSANGEGAIITLSDKSKSGMFSIGSARPTPELVNAMEKLGQIVSKQDGLVEISGHTDGRPYQSGEYDNWRLSTARAHMAYYMLVRGGMPEKRVEKITGQADVNLKYPETPYASGNRRIEVLVKLP